MRYTPDLLSKSVKNLCAISTGNYPKFLRVILISFKLLLTKKEILLYTVKVEQRRSSDDAGVSSIGLIAESQLTHPSIM